MMDGTISGRKESDNHWLLFPLLLIVAMLVIALSTLSVIALIGMIPGTHSDAAQREAPKSDVERKPTKSPADTSRRHLTGGAAGVNECCVPAEAVNKVASLSLGDDRRSADFVRSNRRASVRGATRNAG
jgi:hypothetical protein